MRLPRPSRSLSASIDSSSDAGVAALVRPVPRGALFDYGETRRLSTTSYEGPLGLGLFSRRVLGPPLGPEPRPSSAPLRPSDGEEGGSEPYDPHHPLRTSATAKAWRSLFFHKGGKSGPAGGAGGAGGAGAVGAEAGSAGWGDGGGGLHSSLQSLQEAEATYGPTHRHGRTPRSEPSLTQEL